MKSILTNKNIRVLLPMVACVLVLGGLAAILQPAYSKAQSFWRAQRGESDDAESDSKKTTTLQVRSGGSTTYRQNGVTFSEGGISLPKHPTAQAEEQENFDVSSLDGNYSLPSPLMFQGSQDNNKRRLTKAERKRLEEKRDQKDNWAYSDTSSEDEDIINGKDGENTIKDDVENFEEEGDTVESIILGSKKNVKVYRSVWNKKSKTDKTDKTDTASAQRDENDKDGSKTGSKYSRDSLNASTARDYSSRDIAFSSSDSSDSSLFADDFTSDRKNLWDDSDNPFLNGTAGNRDSLFDFAQPQNDKLSVNSLEAIEKQNKSLDDFRAMISSAGRADSAVSSSKKVIISGASDSLLGGSGTDKFSFTTSKASRSLPTLDTAPTASSSRESANTLLEKPVSPRDDPTSSAVPRLNIRRY